MDDFPEEPLNARSTCFLYFFIIIPTSKQDLDEAFGRDGQKTHWNIKDDSQAYKGR